MNAKSSPHRPSFDLALVSPEGTLLHAKVEMLEFASSVGELGVLPGHAPMLVDLAPGELRLHRNGTIDQFAVAGGFVQVYPALVRVVATFVTSSLATDEIEAACQRARIAMEQAAGEDPALIAASLADFRRELIHLRHSDVTRYAAARK